MFAVPSLTRSVATTAARQVAVRAGSTSSTSVAARAASSASTSSLLASASTRARLFPPSAGSVAIRSYASGGGPSPEDIEKRIREVLTSFEKVKPAAIAPSASFVADLGLDSLDAVEVVMAIEEEFNIEIPDEEADNITTVQQAIDYVSHAPEAV
ncbi:mitochondrial acyl carrier protein [Tilletia horrida]|uniref:Acyl carrier protein n=1 Tax=Tilletia horrida TaxID=155126 RepID=A0AAN6JRM7_9BASI|nr:mitochondrial acyl carrier protein [Tilletia horrida]